MARLNVYVPDELAGLVRERLPGLNVSKVLRRALSGLLACDHVVLGCRACSAELSRGGLDTAAVAAFWLELAPELERLAWQDGTAVGAAAVVWRVAKAHGVPTGPAPRPTRAERDNNRARWRDERTA